MADQIYIGRRPKGMMNVVSAFNIDNEAFPFLYNFYEWRLQVKRKRGTAYIGQLARQVSISATPANYQHAQFALVAGAGNFITSLVPADEQASATIVPGSINITVNAINYVDTLQDGTLTGGTGGTINYASGDFTIDGGGANNVTGTVSYYPGLPVMGLQDFVSSASASDYPLLLGFDTKYSYQINQSTQPNFFYNTAFYKNSQNPFTWSGDDYQLFWTTNYQGALWATNGKPGLHFLNATYLAGSGTSSINFNFKSNAANYNDLVVGDKLFFNEWTTNTSEITDATQADPVVLTSNNTFAVGQQIRISGVNGMTELNQGIYTITAVTATTITLNVNGKEFQEYTSGGTCTLVETETINGETGTVSAVLGAGDYTVDFLDPQTVAGTGIVQMLTKALDGQDGIRWYDGDPTSGTGVPTGVGLGWVNFMPPLTNLTVSIDNKSAAKYYLVGAQAIIPFKDRLLFFKPTIQSSTGAPTQLIDTVLWSWNGTPYYASPVPTGETFDVSAYFVDQTGKGGYLPAGIEQPMQSFGFNEDAIIVGFGGRGRKTRLNYTGNDLQPFLFYNINNEYPSSSPFSSVILDKGMIDVGIQGITITDQQSCQRIDLDIADEVFRIRAANNGFARVNAQRDFTNEWIYFSYPVNNINYDFPTQTFLYNYREQTWAILYENYTVHGYFRPTTKYTWATIPYRSWDSWRVPWNAGQSSPLIPKTIAGNPQGYVLEIGLGTDEAKSGTIKSISNVGGFLQVTSVDHCVLAANPNTGTGDYLYFQGALGTTAINGQIGQVLRVIDNDNFVVDLPFPAGTYGGKGTFTRLSQPLLQTKQFNPYWEQGRKVWMLAQKYLFDFTQNGQVTVNIYLSQNADQPYNNAATNTDGLEYTQLVYTCPESTNLGLTPANTNLQMPIAQGSAQIWHRYNTSLIGDSVQIGITLSDAQMRNLEYATSEINLQAIQLTVVPSSLLA